MSALDVEAARVRLGEMWGLKRPVSKAELGRALRMSGRDPGAQIGEYEKGAAMSGPVSCALEMMLAGALPPDGIPRRGG